ncbi:ATPase, T2SS/T4P/T4SS family [Longimicrobium sp.]|uniref:ATPase, T2SS/T4P/T4SS family n=1 Tax=Longimicrobium sp. TaxID=2029185 RepID=UPI002E37438B|nr:ATPase, T2SS/T4P/T4SS family [Longimicrobium sp.]HEX6041890.1 ATPase, T2SS/T4P/T4SS family [Longimicrobium sp.]
MAVLDVSVAAQAEAADEDERDSLEYEFAVQMQRILGPAVMRVFDDHATSEVYANPDGMVWLLAEGRRHEPTGLTLKASEIEGFLNVAAARLQETITPRNPRLQGELPKPVFGGARLQGLIPPVAAGPMFKIRKRPRRVVPLEDYVAQQVMTPAQYDAIRWAITQDFGIVVAGPTGSGKTYLLNALLHEQARLMEDPNAPVYILEDTVEVLPQAPNTVSLRTTPECDFDVLLYVSLRLTPKYLHVSECRRYALQMLEGWATGHPGFCTLHSRSGQGALQRIARLARRETGRDEGWLVAEAIQLVVVIKPTPRGRRVTEVAHCTGYRKGRYLLTRL